MLPSNTVKVNVSEVKRNDVLYRGTGLQGRNRDTECREQTYGHQGGKVAGGGGGGGMNWEIGIDIYTLICIK